jgi:hypothetical protein
MMAFGIPVGGNDAVWILAAGSNAVGFKQAEMMKFWIPADWIDAVLDSSGRKWCSFGFQ